MDDFLVYAKRLREMLFKIKLNPNKTDAVSTFVLLCTRDVSKDGISSQNEGIEGYLKSPEPQSAGESTEGFKIVRFPFW